MSTQADIKTMAFIDGENLVMRYQAMLTEGADPKAEVTHVLDTVIWHPRLMDACYTHCLLRATYYTYVVGDIDRIHGIADQVQELVPQTGTYWRARRLTPCVMKKERKQQKRRGVDIRICVDMLSHVYRNHLDAVLLLSGDGDFIPLLEEVKRCGKLVIVASFSSGLSVELKRIADHFVEMDNTVFDKRPG